MEFAPVSDFPDGHPRSGLDIMLVCKRWLADQAYTHVIALIPASEVSGIARHFNRGPQSIAEKRPMCEKVRKNLQSMAPRCKASGDISGDSEAFLLQWCQGHLPELAPPANHTLLSYQCPGFSFPDASQIWVPPSRRRHIKLTLPADSDMNLEQEDESDVEDALVSLDT